MTDILRPDHGILFMKVGTHAKESLEDIIARKTAEIEKAGVAFWGYGGNTCHPQGMVQPFAKAFEEKGGAIYLCMEEMESKHFAEPLRADQYSVDGTTWEDINPAINVLGSRFALVIEDLHSEHLVLPLARTQVAVGNSRGRLGSKYIKGRVDKACLAIDSALTQPIAPDEPQVEIGLVAKIVKPYAVYVRNRPR
jgi:hypothetical protein